MNIRSRKKRAPACGGIITKHTGPQPFSWCVIAIATVFVIVGLGLETFAQERSIDSKQVKKETRQMKNAKGEFDVKTVPQKVDNKEAEEAKLGRMTLDKKFHGGLKAISKGEMIYAGTDIEGSGIYVALEKVTGSLGGKTGSFYLHHTGIMIRGVPNLSVSVVPDSGTGELIGITGTMTIRIEGGKHFYELNYTLPEGP